MTRIKKPCPGCKLTMHHRPSVDDVCVQCQERLKTAVEIEEFKAANKGAGNVVVQTVERHYALPNLHHYCQDLGSENSTKLTEAFHELITINIEQKLADNYAKKPDLFVPPYEKNERLDWAITAVMPKRQAVAINALWKAICEVLGNVSEQAHDRGRNLLLGVATGDITVNALNEATSRKGKRT